MYLESYRLTTHENINCVLIVKVRTKGTLAMAPNFPKVLNFETKIL